jgi:hypothetical protein
MDNHNKRLGCALILAVLKNMKVNKPTRTKAISRLLLAVPVVCFLSLAACSDVGETTTAHGTVNLQNATVGGHRHADYVTIGPRSYNPEAKDFERPWPFGPESGAQ